MDLHYKREVTVGALVIAAIALFILGAMWLGGKDLSGADEVVAVFKSVDNLKRGSPVTVSGVQVGRVESVELRRVGEVAVTMSVPSRVALQSDATARIEAIGLVGDQAVALTPGTAPDQLALGTEIPGTVKPGISDLGADLGERAGKVLDGVNAFTNPEMAEALRRTLVSTERLTSLLADASDGPVVELSRTLQSLNQMLARVDRLLADSVPQRTLARFDSAAAGFDLLARQATITTARLDTLLANLNNGRGTMGRLLSDTLLYEDLRGTNRALQELLHSLSQDPGKLNVEVKLF